MPLLLVNFSLITPSIPPSDAVLKIDKLSERNIPEVSFELFERKNFGIITATIVNIAAGERMTPPVSEKNAMKVCKSADANIINMHELRVIFFFPKSFTPSVNSFMHIIPLIIRNTRLSDACRTFFVSSTTSRIIIRMIPRISREADFINADRLCFVSNFKTLRISFLLLISKGASTSFEVPVSARNSKNLFFLSEIPVFVSLGSSDSGSSGVS